ncbi:MAG: PAS domain S-box protein, partial [Candidatus Hodarchaeota archaeon]
MKKNLWDYLEDEHVPPDLREAIQTELTERRQLEADLRDQKSRFHPLFNKVNDPMFLHEVKDRKLSQLLDVNELACQRLGYSKDELLAMPPKQILFPTDQPEIPALIEMLFTQGYSVFESIHVTKDGSQIPVEVSARFFSIDECQVILSVARDISQRKRAEQQLQQASTTVKELNESLKIITSILRHDLANNLTIAQGYLDLYQDTTEASCLAKVSQMLEKSADLISRMRDLEYLVCQDKPLQPYNLRPVVETVLEKYALDTVKVHLVGEGRVLADPAL